MLKWFMKHEILTIVIVSLLSSVLASLLLYWLVLTPK